MSPQSRPAGARAKTATKTTESKSARPIPIVALDFPRADLALAMVERLGDACRFYKVGGELFTAAVTVAAVARRWGWTSPGQFTAAYQRRFGETPGRTLRT